MTAYYNEFDKNAAAWLRELISDDLIAPGDVDERSIIDVKASDLIGYSQHHFFAGIGGWSYALRLANWRDDMPVWTASLPCQPFSAAGKQLGKKDERHLLPHFLELVKKCNPDTIFGEQVERAIGHGWLDDLQATMEAEGYAIGHCVLGAHSVNAAHIRQRLYWVADNNKQRLEGRQAAGRSDKFPAKKNSMVDRMGISNGTRSQQGIETSEAARYRRSFESAGDASRMGYAEHNGRITGQIKGSHESPIQYSETGKNCASELAGASASSSISWLYCRDNKYRPIESGLKPLVDGVPRGMVHSSDPRNTQEARAMRLKGYGNAIVPQLAAEFIRAFMDVTKPPPRTSR